MDKKTLHVVKGQSIGAMVRHGLGLKGIKEEIVFPNLFFSYGYIPKDFSDKELCYALASQGQIEMFDRLKEFILRDYSAFDRIIVWHGWSSEDLFLLYLMSAIVDNNLYHVDIRDSDGLMEILLSRNGNPSNLYPDIASVSANDIYTYDMVSLAKPLSDEEKNAYKEQWYRWANSNTIYRFSDTHDGIIKAYPEDFMDAAIFEIANKTSRILSVAGHVMCEFEHLSIRDVIIFERINELVREGRLLI